MRAARRITNLPVTCSCTNCVTEVVPRRWHRLAAEFAVNVMIE